MLDWVLLLAVSVLQANDEPVMCDLSPQNSFHARRGPEALVAECGGAPSGAQVAADETLAQMDMDLPRLGRYQRYQVANELRIERSGAEWRASAGQILIFVEPSFPARAAEYGSTHMLCALGLSPDETGRVEDARIECLADVRQAICFMERNAAAAVEGWRLAPAKHRYCLDEQIYVQGAIIVRGGPAHEPNPMPDPGDLPSMCEA